MFRATPNSRHFAPKKRPIQAKFSELSPKPIKKFKKTLSKQPAKFYKIQFNYFKRIKPQESRKSLGSVEARI